MTVVEHVTNALTKHDLEQFGEVGDLSQYEELAEIAVRAYEEFSSAPRPHLHFVEGLHYL